VSPRRPQRTAADARRRSAGVAGLTTALLLSKDAATSVTVVAKHMPGDLSIEYASPWAGANFLPVSIAGSEAERWDRDTWPELERLARDVPGAGVHFQGRSTGGLRGPA
jgi:D-amino-acid oxidase